MMTSREQLKKSILAALDRVAEEHEVGHQSVKGARYSLRADSGRLVEIMFEKDADSPPNLWCLDKLIGEDIRRELQFARYPKTDLFQKIGKDGEPDYGRHSALLGLNKLERADLLRIEIKNLLQLNRVIACLKAA